MIRTLKESHREGGVEGRMGLGIGILLGGGGEGRFGDGEVVGGRG